MITMLKKVLLPGNKEALSQIMPKALGLNVGGKIGIARYKSHVSVAVFSGLIASLK